MLQNEMAPLLFLKLHLTIEAEQRAINSSAHCSHLSQPLVQHTLKFAVAEINVRILKCSGAVAGLADVR